jgi:hypothetical protein
MMQLYHGIAAMLFRYHGYGWRQRTTLALRDVICSRDFASVTSPYNHIKSKPKTLSRQKMYCRYLHFKFRHSYGAVLCVFLNKYSLNSRVGIVNIPLAWRPRNYGSIPGRDNKYFSSPKRPNRIWGTPSFLCSICRRLYHGTAIDPRIRSSTPNSNEVENVWRYTSAAPYAFMTCTGVNLSLVLHLHYNDVKNSDCLINVNLFYTY